jgi:hypothetical protein
MTPSRKASARLALILLAGLVLAGCSASVGNPKASFATLEMLQGWDAPAMRAGAFALAPGLPASMDRSVSVRTTSVSSPEGGFARHLRATLEAQLRAVGKYDDASGIVIEGLLTRSSASAGLSDGHAVLAARFSVIRNGRQVFGKQLEVQSDWGSTFVGVEAIPDAINHYTALYDELVRQLLADDEFRRALTEPE